jgi:hypothetical protein
MLLDENDRPDQFLAESLHDGRRFGLQVRENFVVTALRGAALPLTREDLFCRDLPHLTFAHLLEPALGHVEPELLALGFGWLLQALQEIASEIGALPERELQGFGEEVFSRHDAHLTACSLRL